LVPPNGTRASEAVIALMNAAPLVICFAKPTPRSVDPVHRLNDSPNGVALANRTTSASSLATTITATGPNVSSSNTGTPGPSAATTVGG
jgi:hypothetical protein